MKKHKFIKVIFFLSFLLPLRLLAQEDITGLWKGTLYNDTTKQYLPYEIAISDDNGKLTGYSYTVFKGEKGDEIGVKTIRIKRKKEKIIIEDVDLISNTYTIEVSKKVKKFIDLTLMVKDSIMIMSGSWKTNYLKEYRPVTGTIKMQKKNDHWREEPLIKKLDELNLLDNLSFNHPAQNRETLVATGSPTLNPQKKQELTITNKRISKNETQQVAIKKDSSAAVTESSKNIKKQKKQEQQIASKTISEKQNEAKKKEAIENKPAPIIKAAADADKRKTQTIQSVYFKTDSLVFTVYDNGIVDGDTVSILMDKKLIFSKQGLTDKPISKTIYTKDIPDSSMLILYAENLGSIPPNTGLLIIYDGKTRYEIFFSADLDNNAAVILRRKKSG